MEPDVSRLWRRKNPAKLSTNAQHFDFDTGRNSAYFMLLSLTMRWTILFQKQKPGQQKCKLAHWHLNHANGVELKPPQKQFNNQTQKHSRSFHKLLQKPPGKANRDGSEERNPNQIETERRPTKDDKKRQRSQRSYTTRYKKQTTQRRYWNPGTKLRFEIPNCQNRSCESNKATPEYETKKKQRT
jgi:hypothetical protein